MQATQTIAPLASINLKLQILPPGYFYAGQSDTGVKAVEEMEDEASTILAETLWLVYKWENLQPVSFYPAAEQPKLRTGLQFWAVDDETESLRARCGMLRSAVWLLKLLTHPCARPHFAFYGQ